MKLSVISFALAFAILWTIAILGCALANLIWPNYATGFLHLIGSIYPGYHASRTATSIVIVTAYALVDGAVGGALLASLYNLLLRWCNKNEAVKH